ncbi:unnamed protein product, partial [Ectocarpus sp. 12 AP-2014]
HFEGSYPCPSRPLSNFSRFLQPVVGGRVRVISVSDAPRGLVGLICRVSTLWGKLSAAVIVPTLPAGHPLQTVDSCETDRFHIDLCSLVRSALLPLLCFGWLLVFDFMVHTVMYLLRVSNMLLCVPVCGVVCFTFLCFLLRFSGSSVE